MTCLFTGFSAEKYLLVVNAANIEKDWEWCVKNAARFGIAAGPEKEMHNASDWTAQLAVQGPLALKAMQKLTDDNVTDMEYYTFKVLKFAGIDNVIFSTTGYTGAGGCEIYIRNVMPSVSGKLFSKPVKSLASNPLAWVQGTHSALRWDTASTEMTSMTLHHRSRPGWDG